MGVMLEYFVACITILASVFWTHCNLHILAEDRLIGAVKVATQEGICDKDATFIRKVSSKVLKSLSWAQQSLQMLCTYIVNKNHCPLIHLYKIANYVNRVKKLSSILTRKMFLRLFL